MAESKTDVERDIEQTRERMAGTVRELEQRYTQRLDAVKEKLDVPRMARAHPWAALGIAFGGGLLLSVTKADEKLAEAVANAATSAASALADVARHAADVAVASAQSAIQRVQGEGETQATPAAPAGAGEPGIVDRVKEKVVDTIARPADRVLDEMRAASVEVAYPKDTVLPAETPEPRNAEPSSWGVE